MSDHKHDKHEHEELQELAAGYALDSLEPGDEAALLAHLPRCAKCRQLVDELRATAAQLAYDVTPAAPSDSVRAAVLAAVGHDESAAPLELPRLATVTRLHRPSARVLSAAAAAVVLVGGSALVLREHSDAQKAKTQYTADQQVLTAIHHPGAKVYTMRASAGSATGFTVVDGATLWLSVKGLPRNDTSASTYVLWSVSPQTGATAVRTFDVTSAKEEVVFTAPAPLGESSYAISYEQGRTAPAAPTQKVLG